MVKLIATQGADEANFGTSRFRVDNDGTIDVPQEAVASLTKTGGFILAKTDTPTSAGFVKISHPEKIGASYGGVSYEPDAKGVLIVPAEAVEELAAHGFTPVGQTIEQVRAGMVNRIVPAAPGGDAIVIGEPGQSASWGGLSFTADDEGLMIVPLAAVSDLVAHGFILADTAPEAEAALEPKDETVVEQPVPVTEQPVALVEPAAG